MAMNGEDWNIGDVVLILDPSASDRQPPFPQLGLIHDWMDTEKSQAIIHYGKKDGIVKVVNLTSQLDYKIGFSKRENT